MANYRGQDNNISPQTAELIRQINAGTTPSQRRRDLQRRVTLGGISAGLTGTAGLASMIYGDVKAQRAEERDLAEKSAITKAAIANASRAVGKRSDGTWGGNKYAPDTGQVDPYTAPVFTGAGARSMAPEEAAKDEPLHTQSFAKSILSGIDASEDGVQLPYGAEGQKVWNRRAFDEAEEQAGLMARDIGLARTIIAAQRGY